MLSLYNKKRNFKQTPEPAGHDEKENAQRCFVVQQHNASHLHYDFRLQLNGVLKSWAVPKGPSMNAADKRLAVQVEDHPVSYINFSGTIPKGNYGAGTVKIWDKGSYTPIDEKGNDLTDKQAISWLKKGQLKFKLAGKKLKGEFVLVQLKKDPKNWLLIKHAIPIGANKKMLTAPDKSEVAKNKPVSNDIKISVKKSIATQPHSAATRVPLVSKQKKLLHYHKPMLATPAGAAFDDAAWIFEIKWDGYRAIAECGGKELRFYSRNGFSFIHKYPAVANALDNLTHNMVLDGEVVVLDAAGKPSFQLLQQYDEHPEYHIVYYVFDLLFLNGTDIRDQPLSSRKALLKKALPASKNGIIRFCDHVKKEGVSFFNKATELNLEGIIAKKADSIYAAGTRNKEWLKIKQHNTREAVIAGFTQPKGSRKHIGALILAEQRGKKLTYIGHTGTGFTDKTLTELWTQLQPYIVPASPFKEKIQVNAPVTWLKPTLVCQVKFAEQTTDGMLRHPVYLGLRADKAAKEVEQRTETLVKKTVTVYSEKEKIINVNNHAVQLTNLTKIYWPKDRITKAALINYYEKIAPIILPYLKNRPLSLKRNPNGIADKGFYQKDAGEHFPPWIKTVPVYSDSSNKTVHYTICNDKATLLYLANLGCIEMNPWNSTTSTADNPSYLIIDIDPSDKNNFEQVIETAQVTAQILKKAGAAAYCKTSGATGLHIFVPLGAKYNYEQARNFAEIIANLVQEQLPGFTSLERSLNKRGNKIYIDYLQNSKGQTVAAAYSVRPVAGATISAPLSWKEVKKGLHPGQFTIFNIEKRIKTLGDIFCRALQKGVDIGTCLKNLGY